MATDKRAAEADRRVGAADNLQRAQQILVTLFQMPTGHSTYQHRRLHHRGYRSKRACPQPTGSSQQLEGLAPCEFRT